jgi:3-oxoacyl-[acyl-carrier protein] reductase
MDLQLAGKSALVVGASKGLGRAIVRRLAAEGCRVAAAARSADLLGSLADELTKTGTKLLPFAGDLATDGGPAALLAGLNTAGFVPDVVVHNLGGSLQVTDALASAADYHRVWRLNVGVPVELNGALVPAMQKSGWGRVVHVSSVSAENYSGYSAYVAAKGSLNAYVKALSRSVAATGVVVSAVCPGPLFNEGRYLAKMQQAAGPEWRQYCEHHLSIGRLADPDEIAPFIALLCSPLASFAVGTIMNLDGGSR